jgi:tetratricopeptide (TPR) repeat protein
MKFKTTLITKHNFKKTFCLGLLFVNLITHAQTNIDSLILSGLQKAQNGNLDSALVDFNNSITIKPTSKGYFYRGGIHTSQKQFQKGIDDYSKAIQLDSNFAEAYAQRATNYMTYRKHYRGLRDINKAIKIEPNNGNLYYLRSAIKAILGDNIGACSDMKIAVKLGNKWGNKDLENACKKH